MVDPRHPDSPRLGLDGPPPELQAYCLLRQFNVGVSRFLFELSSLLTSSEPRAELTWPLSVLPIPRRHSFRGVSTSPCWFPECQGVRFFTGRGLFGQFSPVFQMTTAAHPPSTSPRLWPRNGTLAAPAGVLPYSVRFRRAAGSLRTAPCYAVNCLERPPKPKGLMAHAPRCAESFSDGGKFKTAVQVSLAATADRRHPGLDPLFHGALMQSVFDPTVKSRHRRR